MTRRFAFRNTAVLRWLFVALGLGPRRSWVELDDAELRVRLGIGFRARIARGSIRTASAGGSAWLSIGIHTNLRFDTWLVNAAPRPIVWLDLDPRARGRVYGIPVRFRRLGLGLDDAEGFLQALGL